MFGWHQHGFRHYFPTKIDIQQVIFNKIEESEENTAPYFETLMFCLHDKNCKKTEVFWRARKQSGVAFNKTYPWEILKQKLSIIVNNCGISTICNSLWNNLICSRMMHYHHYLYTNNILFTIKKVNCKIFKMLYCNVCTSTTFPCKHN